MKKKLCRLAFDTTAKRIQNCTDFCSSAPVLPFFMHSKEKVIGQ